MAFYIVDQNQQIMGEVIGSNPADVVIPESWQILEGAIAPLDELYVENGKIKKREPKPSPDHFLGVDGEWVLPQIEEVAGIDAIAENWQGLEDDLRESAAWAQVYDAAGRTLKANRAFTFMYGTLTRTHNTSDLKLAIADTRDSMRGITGVGDFSADTLKWLKERLEANGFDPSEFDLSPH